MKINVSALTDTAQANVDQDIATYQDSVAAHVGGDWGVHTQMCLYGTIPYTEPVTGNTIDGAVLLRVLLSGTNTGGFGDGIFAIPAVILGTQEASGIAPYIVQPPVSQSVNAGASAAFTVTAASATAESYQWNFNGTAITSAVGQTYTITDAQAANAGSYAAVVSNNFGATTSASAVLTVIS